MNETRRRLLSTLAAAAGVGLAAPARAAVYAFSSSKPLKAAASPPAGGGATAPAGGGTTGGTTGGSTGGATTGGGTPSRPVLSSVPDQSARVGQPVMVPAPSVTGGLAPYFFTASVLPPGLAMDPGRGTISGSPVDAGTFAVTITVTDASGAQAATTFVVIVTP